MKNNLPIGQMLKDVEIVERTLPQDMQVSPIADVCCHVKALAAEVELLRNRLHPFAHQARIIDENDKADGNGPEETFAMFRFRNSYAAICLGDCRRAREALE